MADRDKLLNPNDYEEIFDDRVIGLFEQGNKAHGEVAAPVCAHCGGTTGYIRYRKGSRAFKSIVFALKMMGVGASFFQLDNSLYVAVEDCIFCAARYAGSRGQKYDYFWKYKNDQNVLNKLIANWRDGYKRFLIEDARKTPVKK